jgi:hypothetical protein
MTRAIGVRAERELFALVEVQAARENVSRNEMLVRLVKKALQTPQESRAEGR